MTISSKQSDPSHFRVPELFEAFYPIKLGDDDVITIMHPKPIGERRLFAMTGQV